MRRFKPSWSLLVSTLNPIGLVSSPKPWKESTLRNWFRKSAPALEQHQPLVVVRWKYIFLLYPNNFPPIILCSSFFKWLVQTAREEIRNEHLSLMGLIDNYSLSPRLFWATDFRKILIFLKLYLFFHFFLLLFKFKCFFIPFEYFFI